MRPYTGTWKQFSSSIFTVMTQEAIKAGAVNLAQGFPDFDGPQTIKDGAMAAIQAGHNQYCASAGWPQLREALAGYQQRKSGVGYDPQGEITVFSGATEALFCTIMALCEPGDELITFEPFYDSYLGSAVAARATLKPVRLHPPHWHFDRQALADAITPRTKALLLNTPHNPTGKVFTQEELRFVADLVRAHDLYVITDEVYEELIYAPGKHQSLASLPGMRERTVLISSTSKTFSFTGWKVGYAFAPPDLSQALRAVHQFTVFCSATPLQAGLTNAFTLPASYYEELRVAYQQKRDLLLTILREVGFRCEAPLGTYFIMADYSHLSERCDTDFALWLTRKAKVACIPISPFYLQAPDEQRYVRFGFCKHEDTLQAAGDNLRRFLRAP